MKRCGVATPMSWAARAARDAGRALRGVARLPSVARGLLICAACSTGACIVPSPLTQESATPPPGPTILVFTSESEPIATDPPLGVFPWTRGQARELHPAARDPDPSAILFARIFHSTTSQSTLLSPYSGSDTVLSSANVSTDPLVQRGTTAAIDWCFPVPSGTDGGLVWLLVSDQKFNDPGNGDPAQSPGGHIAAAFWELLCE